MPERIALILNPQSGSVDLDIEARTLAALGEAGADCEVKEIRPGADGADLVREAVEQGYRHVMASGGDGTLMAVVNGLRETHRDIVLSVVPGGTANLIAAALGVPSEVEEAVRVALAGEERSIDLGRCGDRVFALGVGVGLAERLIAEAPDELKARVGRLAYAWSALREVGSRPRRFTLQLDDEAPVRVAAVGIVVANVGGIGSTVKYAPSARVDDGLLDVCVLHRFGWPDVFRLGAKTVAGGLEEDRALTYYQCARLTLESGVPLPVQLDGDPVDMTTPVRIEVLPAALRVRVPRASD